ncbi:polysaccharide pyruvyl transferase family protein [Agarivorans sp. QJM3NY_29]|uniref:polysaccharide pyruvyl transferase family protein n=1 Tax=unclassified Agarivorans TaxID=2636026 RepID=UPI003D7C7422
MKVALMNCYSSKNSGDGLLVELACQYIKKQHGQDTEIIIVCSDPDSFNGDYQVLGNEFSRSGILGHVAVLLKVIGFLLFGRYSAKQYQSLQNCDRFYSVGGGYLRFGSLSEALKTLIVHCSQIAWVKSNINQPHILLSQSIGPLRYVYSAWLSRLLANTEQVFVRDDKTVAELKNINLQSTRVKDMAVSELIRKFDSLEVSTLPHSSTCILILRDLRRGKAVNHKFLKELEPVLAQFESVVYAVQSEVNSNNDGDFYQQYGISDFISVKEALTKYPQALVISVRLHGAIESLLAGFKTFHLSYERKGFGAYQDLNISEYVDNAYNFNSVEVEERVAKLRAMNEMDFFNQIRASL